MEYRVADSSQDNTLDDVMQKKDEWVVHSTQDNTIDDVMQREYKKAAFPKERLRLGVCNEVVETKSWEPKS